MNEGHAEGERYGRLFWVSLIVGWSGIGFGVISALSHAGAARPVALGAYVLGALVVHDLVVVPVALAFAVVVGRRLPAHVRGPLLGAVVVSAVVALASYPAVRGFGRFPGNPSLLPRDYAAGLLLVLFIVWAVTAALVFGSIRRGRVRHEAPREPIEEVDR